MTLLKTHIDNAIVRWDTTNPEMPSSGHMHAIVQAAQRDFINQYGQDRFDLEVVQDGGRYMMLGISDSFEVMHRNQVRLLRHAGLIPMEPTG